MTSLAALNARMRKVEQRTIRTNPVPWTKIITETDEDRDRQIAAQIKAGTHQSDWNVIEWRIVDPKPRNHP